MPDARELCFACSCGRAFLALPALNPLHPPTFWDGEHVVSHCPDCGAGLQWMFYHGTSARHPNEAHMGRTGESTSTSGCRAGASCADAPAFSPPAFPPAGETGTLPAGAEVEIEWAFTCRRRDGRIVVEGNHEAQ